MGNSQPLPLNCGGPGHWEAPVCVITDIFVQIIKNHYEKDEI